MRLSVSPSNRDRLMRALRVERREDGLLDATLLRLDPGQGSAVLRQTMSPSFSDFLADGAPFFDTRDMDNLPPGLWPARRTAGGWIALIDDSVRSAASVTSLR